MKTDYNTPVEKFLEDRGINFEYHYIGQVKKWGNREKSAYVCSFFRSDTSENKYFTTEFFCNDKPTAYDVLSCLTKSPIGDVWEFFEEFGYEPTKENFIVYEAVKAEYAKVSEFFSESELEELQELAQ